MVEFGNRLKALRIQNKMTQAKTADRLGVTKSVISAYETGIRMPSYEILLKISSLFRVTTDYLLNNEKNNIDVVDLSGLTFEEKQSLRNLIRAMKKSE